MASVFDVTMATMSVKYEAERNLSTSRRTLKRYNLTPAGLRVLSLANGQTLGVLAAECGVSRPNLTTIVRGLVRGGHLVRSRSEIDSRLIHVNRTAKGQKALAELRAV